MLGMWSSQPRTSRPARLHRSTVPVRTVLRFRPTSIWSKRQGSTHMKPRRSRRVDDERRPTPAIRDVPVVRLRHGLQPIWSAKAYGDCCTSDISNRLSLPTAARRRSRTPSESYPPSTHNVASSRFRITQRGDSPRSAQRVCGPAPAGMGQ